MLRLAGAGRAETAAAVVAATVGSEPPVVFLATGDAFPDALAGGPAAAVSGGPILLATSSGIPSATLEEMERLSPERIVLLGGSAALGPEVETAAAEIAPVERIAGSDRISTAAAISAATFPDGSNVAYIATGSDFPDALAGGAVAGADGAPLLLADAGGLPGATRDELQRLDPERIVLLGGAAALPGTLEQALTDELGAEVVRLAGSDRTSTAAAIAERFPSGSTGVAVLATGENFPDALAATPTAAAYGAPLLLTTGDALAGPAAAALERIGPSRLLAVGGT